MKRRFLSLLFFAALSGGFSPAFGMKSKTTNETTISCLPDVIIGIIISFAPSPDLIIGLGSWGENVQKMLIGPGGLYPGAGNVYFMKTPKRSLYWAAIKLDDNYLEKENEESPITLQELFAASDLAPKRNGVVLNRWIARLLKETSSIKFSLITYRKSKTFDQQKLSELREKKENVPSNDLSASLKRLAAENEEDDNLPKKNIVIPMLSFYFVARGIDAQCDCHALEGYVIDERFLDLIKKRNDSNDALEILVAAYAIASKFSCIKKILHRKIARKYKEIHSYLKEIFYSQNKVSEEGLKRQMVLHKLEHKYVIKQSLEASEDSKQLKEFIDFEYLHLLS